MGVLRNSLSFIMREMKREWFVIRTKPHKEIVALENFERQGFLCYLPTIVKTVRHARQTKEVVRPFFPGYLFLLLAEEERAWETIGSTRGVLAPIKFGNYYPPVPEEIILGLRAREDNNSRIILPDAVTLLKPGQKVAVDGICEEGVVGKFVGLRGQDRAVVLIDLLQRQVSATVPMASILVDD